MTYTQFGKKMISGFLTLAMLFVFAIPSFAAESNSQSLDIRLKIGSNQMLINGEASKVQAPYLTSGTTMVPLSVITKAFGMKLQLQNNKTITLKDQNHVVILNIGSKTTEVDGKKSTLTVAPLIKQGVTMVPLRVVLSFGAKVSYNAATMEIRITGSASTAANPVTGIDTDAGKSKIGDSYYQWSMNYPTGLVQDFQSDDGGMLIFRDVKEEYYLGVFVTEDTGELTSEEKRELIWEYVESEETLVDKRTITKTYGSVERFVTKDTSGFYYEYWGIQKNEHFYVTVFGKKASSVAELSKYSSILDSFRPAFNKSDSALKDLSRIIDGMKTFEYKDYGMTVKLPKEWTNETESYPEYDNGDAYYLLKVSSLVAGDTVDAWIKRKVGYFERVFAQPYHKVLEQRNVKWNGIDAQVVKLAYSYDTEFWWEEYEVFAVKGDYRYYMEFAYDQAMKDDYSTMLDTILSSTKLEFSTVERNFGHVTDDDDMVDYSSTVTKTSRKYGYSITFPQHWSSMLKDFEEPYIAYSFNGGHFSVSVSEDVTDPQEYYTAIEEIYEEEKAENSNYKMVENTTVTIAGQTAKKYVFEDTEGLYDGPYREFLYIIHYNGKFYEISGNYALAQASDFLIKQLEDMINSFKF